MNAIRRAMAEGRPTFGCAQIIPNTLLSEIVGGARAPAPEDGSAPVTDGFDWAFLDTQHTGMTLDNVTPMIQALQLGGMDPVIRVAWNEQHLIMRALDLGAIGVIIPMVSTPEEALNAAQAMRYPPDGVRSFGPVRAARSTEQANEDVVCLVMVETVEGLENLEAIAATPGVDGIFVGPVDLGLSMGLGLTDYTRMHDEVLEAIDQVIAVCEARGLIPGTITLGDDNVEDLLRRGMRLLNLGVDVSYLRQGLTRDLAKAESWTRAYTRQPAGQEER